MHMQREQLTYFANQHRTKTTASSLKEGHPPLQGNIFPETKGCCNQYKQCHQQDKSIAEQRIYTIREGALQKLGLLFNCKTQAGRNTEYR